MKLPARMLMRALRLYGLADDNTPLKAIRRLSAYDGESFVRLEFVLGKHAYGVLYGSVISEDAIADFWPGHPEPLELLPSPLDPTTHETPFQGKLVIVMRLPLQTQRLDQFLATTFDPAKSRSQWQKHIKAGHVLVNGAVARSSKQEVSDTDDIAVSFPEPPIESHIAQTLYEDSDVIVINKPAGMLTHAKGGIVSEITAADAYRNRTTFATDSDRPGIVHRLDRDTSGVLIIARTPEAATHLQRQFARRTAKKTYLAITAGTPKHLKARIDLPIGRTPSKPSTFRIDPNGKPAQTDYEVIATRGNRSLIVLRPRTGRTHQLRVHLQHLGTPIIGDRVYGQPDSRLFLHAYQLTITLPSGDEKTFTAPIPSEFTEQFPEVTTWQRQS
ncbi:MAG: RluA family pseudouridine synthase [Candidatus Saccharibacteria bacterium]|nr:RluA family pseudouridine synthase [Candidatus Saccharibacteria bacterium]